MYDNPAFRTEEEDEDEVHPPPYPDHQKRSRFPSPPRLMLNDVTEMCDEVSNNNEISLDVPLPTTPPTTTPPPTTPPPTSTQQSPER